MLSKESVYPTYRRVLSVCLTRLSHFFLSTSACAGSHPFLSENSELTNSSFATLEGLWAFGTWVNGGVWTTEEARLQLGYYRVNATEDCLRSMQVRACCFCGLIFRDFLFRDHFLLFVNFAYTIALSLCEPL